MTITPGCSPKWTIHNSIQHFQYFSHSLPFRCQNRPKCLGRNTIKEFYMNRIVLVKDNHDNKIFFFVISHAAKKMYPLKGMMSTKMHNLFNHNNMHIPNTHTYNTLADTLYFHYGMFIETGNIWFQAFNLTLSHIEANKKWLRANSIKPEQPASNAQSDQVLCCLLFISI